MLECVRVSVLCVQIGWVGNLTSACTSACYTGKDGKQIQSLKKHVWQREVEHVEDISKLVSRGKLQEQILRESMRTTGILKSPLVPHKDSVWLKHHRHCAYWPHDTFVCSEHAEGQHFENALPSADLDKSHATETHTASVKEDASAHEVLGDGMKGMAPSEVRGLCAEMTNTEEERTCDWRNECSWRHQNGDGMDELEGWNEIERMNQVERAWKKDLYWKMEWDWKNEWGGKEEWSWKQEWDGEKEWDSKMEYDLREGLHDVDRSNNQQYWTNIQGRENE